MWQRFGKRLLILLPAVWLIASVVFLLSRTMPGTVAADLLEQQGQGLNSTVKAEARAAAYRQQLRRTGQDQPLFYFSFGIAAEPDTLYRIFPEQDRLALKKLVLRYGNWPATAAYYHQWQVLKMQLLTSETSPEQFRRRLNLTEKLLQSSAPETIMGYFRSLKKTVGPEGSSLEAEIKRTETAFQDLVETASQSLTYIPAVHWHGTQNQYHFWFRQLFQGNLGYSSRDARPVAEVLAEAFLFTFWLAFSAFIIVVLLTPEIGIYLCRKSAGRRQKLLLAFLYGLESLPMFLVALLVLSLASAAGWLFHFPEEVAFFLAVLCLVLVNLPYLAAQSFAALQQELKQPYLLAARAKGLSEERLLRGHALRNSLLPLITLLSDFFPALLAGSVVLEVVFSLPGMGRLLVDAVLSRDYDVITGIVLLTGFLKMLAHLVADILYVIADPRLRAASAS